MDIRPLLLTRKWKRAYPPFPRAAREHVARSSALFWRPAARPLALSAHEQLGGRGPAKLRQPELLEAMKTMEVVEIMETM